MLNAETMLPASVCNFPLLCLVFALVGQNIHCLQVDYWCTGVVGFYQTHSQWKLISQLMWVWVKPLVLPSIKSWPQFFFFFLCVLFVCFFFSSFSPPMSVYELVIELELDWNAWFCSTLGRTEQVNLGGLWWSHRQESFANFLYNIRRVNLDFSFRLWTNPSRTSIYLQVKFCISSKLKLNFICETRQKAYAWLSNYIASE